jgi:hypothetical protein
LLQHKRVRRALPAKFKSQVQLQICEAQRAIPGSHSQVCIAVDQQLDAFEVAEICGSVECSTAAAWRRGASDSGVANVTSGGKRVPSLVFGCFYICCTLEQQLADVGVAISASVVQRGIV